MVALLLLAVSGSTVGIYLVVLVLRDCELSASHRSLKTFHMLLHGAEYPHKQDCPPAIVLQLHLLAPSGMTGLA